MFVALDVLVPLVSARQSHERPHAALPASVLYPCLSGQTGAARSADLVNIATGWESAVYTFAVYTFDREYGPDEGRQRQALILRLYLGDHTHAKSAHEFLNMRQLHQAGYPVPSVHLLEPTNSPFGKPVAIMERIAGQVMGPLFFGAYVGKQRKLLALCCAWFVQLHRLDCDPLLMT
jgi:aminoglycoside phosphotransferase (APT) family kinase protein